MDFFVYHPTDKKKEKCANKNILHRIVIHFSEL